MNPALTSIAGALLGLCLFSTRATPQVDHWSIGGGESRQWSEWTSLNVLTDASSMPGALFPIELRPDVNIVAPVFGAHEWELYQSPPNPLYVRGMPRMWRGFGNFGPMSPIRPIARFIDGDVTTFEFATNYGPGGNKMLEEFYTLAFGGALPLERWMIQLPPSHLTDVFGEPWINYVNKHGQLSGALHGGEAQTHLESDNDRAGIHQVYEPLEILLGEVEDNLEAPIVIDFPPQYLRHVRWKSWPDGMAGNTPMIAKLAYAEFELYGRGFAAESRVESKVVDLGRPVILGEVSVGISSWQRQGARWLKTYGDMGELVDRTWNAGELVAAPEADAKVEVRFKTGTTPDSRQYYTYSDAGTLVEIDGDSWKELKYVPPSHFSPLGLENPKYIGWQGPVVQNRETWTPWSGTIDSPGAHLGLASGQYLQILVELASHKPTDVARLDSLSVQLLPVLVPNLVGEVGLVVDAASALLPQTSPGDPAELTYGIRADFGDQQSSGFDAVHIATPSEPELMYLMVGEPLTGVDVAAEEITTDARGITIFLPEPITEDNQIRIGLRTALYTLSTKLEGEVFIRGGSARQVIVEGNATNQIGSDKLQLISGIAIPDAIADLRIEPRIITPNGDGRNDKVRIRYTLFGVLDATVEATIYNLAGQPVRTLTAYGQMAGANRSLAWDGRDESRRPVAPGLYLCELKTETSRGRFARTTSVGVAY